MLLTRIGRESPPDWGELESIKTRATKRIGKVDSMGFVKGLNKGLALIATLGVAAAASSGFAQTTKPAKTPAPTPATERGPSNIDLVNKALNPGASDPDVPLPHPNLANSNVAQSGSPAGPRIYGRQEEGGGVLGLRMPIPAERNSTGRSY